MSQAAQEKAERLGVDLRLKNWHDQPQFDAGRATFHFEHILPVSAIRSECLTLDSEADIFDVLKGRLRVAWILKAEDAELTRLGYRNKRRTPTQRTEKQKFSLWWGVEEGAQPARMFQILYPFLLHSGRTAERATRSSRFGRKMVRINSGRYQAM